MTGVSIGVDVGGTFTDLVSIDADGAAVARKVPSTPADHSDGVMAALDALREESGSVERVVHGTTVATNTLLERSGARCWALRKVPRICSSSGASSAHHCTTSPCTIRIRSFRASCASLFPSA